MRRAARIDANQNEIVEALRAAGCSVAITSALGDGFVDIVVGRSGTTVLMEIKDGAKPLSARRLTDDEQRFHDSWRGAKPVVVNDVGEALAAMTAAEVLSAARLRDVELIVAEVLGEPAEDGL